MSRIEKLAEKQDSVVECANCGASHSITDKICPYCGSTNELGDELDYQKKLENIRLDMEKLESVTDAEYSKGIRQNARSVLIAVAVVTTVIMLLLMLIFAIKTGISRREAKENLEEIQWERRTYAKLDELYANGDFEAINDFYDDYYFTNAWEKHSMSAWQHDMFMFVYRDYSFLQEGYEKVVNSENPTADDVGVVFEYIVNVALTDWDKADYKDELSKKENEFIAEYKKEALDILKVHFHISEEELEAMRPELFDKDMSMVYPDGKMAFEVGRKLKWY